LFGAGAEALAGPAEDEEDRSPNADLVVCGQQADEQRGAAHDQQGGDEDPLAAEAVPVVREEDSAERTGQEANGKRAEAGDHGDGGGLVGKEELAEYEGCRCAVDDEVI
jgi:hypothetical protein